MLDEEIKLIVAKEIEEEKAIKEGELATKKPIKNNLKFKPMLLGKFTNDAFSDNEEPILDRRTTRKIERLSQGRSKCKTAGGGNRKIINEILDEGRLDFLKTQRTGISSAHFSKGNSIIPLTARTPWSSARDRTPYAIHFRSKLMFSIKKPLTAGKFDNQGLLPVYDSKEKQRKKIENVKRMQEGIGLC